MELRGSSFVLRSKRPTDEDAVLRYASDREIWLNMSSRFPHPYSLSDARAWLAIPNPGAFMIDRGGTAIGVVDFNAQDHEHSRTAYIGYWVARPFWGRGIGTEALRLLADHAFSTTDLARLEAHVFEWNPASCRVLEKAGFTREAQLRKAVLKDGKLIDEFIYGRLR